MDEPEDKMSNFALHERLLKVETIIAHFGFYSSMGYFTGIFRSIGKLFGF